MNYLPLPLPVHYAVRNSYTLALLLSIEIALSYYSSTSKHGAGSNCKYLNLVASFLANYGLILKSNVRPVLRRVCHSNHMACAFT